MMRPITVSVLVFATLLSIGTPALSQTPARRAMTHEDMIKMKRVGDPVVSPDGKWIVFTLGEVDYEKNESDLWLMATNGAYLRQLTTAKGSETSPYWSPDSARVAFSADRGEGKQIYILDVKQGGEPRQLTKVPTGASGPKWSPDGSRILFSSAVFPDCRDMTCQEKWLKDWKDRKSKAQAYDELPFRFWDAWRTPQRNHLFTIFVDGSDLRDLLAGTALESPTWPQGGPSEYEWSADGKEVAFVARVRESRDERLAMTTDIFTVAAEGGDPRNITNTPKLSEASPRFSRDGRLLAFTVSDSSTRYTNTHLMIREVGNNRVQDLTASWDRSVEGFAWSGDSRTLYLLADDAGYVKIWSLGARGGNPRELAGDATYEGIAASSDDASIFFKRQRTTMPPEIYSMPAKGGAERQLTDFNRERRSQLDWQDAEHFWFTSAEGSRVHALLIKPPAFDAKKKYPLLLLVHGGPNGAWNDLFHYRWNYQLFAAMGYVVIAPNPHGSTGFGERFATEIAGAWGGSVYQELLSAVDYAVKTYPFVDGERVAAAGGSYGGYMMDWMLGQTSRFRAIISHAGVYDGESMYGTSDIPPFMENNFKGTPWSAPDLYAKWSPSSYAKNFKTATLVTQGGLDYRVPESQGFQLFTALQRLKVPSRFVYFPDENHWILKAANNRVWYEEVKAWLEKYLK